jgi:hypothetical protein
VRRRPVLLASVALLAIVGAGVVAYQVLEPRPRRTRLEPARAPDRPPLPAPGVREEPPAAVTFTVQSEPAGAEVLVGDQPAGHTPTAVRLPKADREVQLVIRASGYKEARRTLRADRDRDLELTLVAEPRPSKPAPIRRASGRAHGSDETPFAPVGD